MRTGTRDSITDIATYRGGGGVRLLYPQTLQLKNSTGHEDFCKSGPGQGRFSSVGADYLGANYTFQPRDRDV